MPVLFFFEFDLTKFVKILHVPVVVVVNIVVVVSGDGDGVAVVNVAVVFGGDGDGVVVVNVAVVVGGDGDGVVVVNIVVGGGGDDVDIVEVVVVSGRFTTLKNSIKTWLSKNTDLSSLDPSFYKVLHVCLLFAIPLENCSLIWIRHQYLT